MKQQQEQVYISTERPTGDTSKKHTVNVMSVGDESRRLLDH